MAATNDYRVMSGPLGAEFRTPALRNAALGAVPLMSEISADVLDASGTAVPCVYQWVRRTIGERSFALEIEAEHAADPSAFRWTAALEGSPEGVIRYTMALTCLRPFLRARAGLGIVHPSDLGGLACRVEDAVGTVREARFPDARGREPVFDEVSAITTVIDGLELDLRFEGDVFETLRTPDGLLRTRCTPSRFPAPLEIQPGACIEQSVTLRVQRLQ